MSGLINAIEISSEGLSVQRKRMNVAAENIANAETTETSEGGPYKRKRVIVEKADKPGAFRSHLKEARTKLVQTDDSHLPARSVRLGKREELASVGGDEVVDPESGVRPVYDPSHPHANDEGYVRMPDIEIVNEMVDMMTASRGYEANTVAIAAAKRMAKNALDIA